MTLRCRRPRRFALFILATLPCCLPAAADPLPQTDDQQITPDGIAFLLTRQEGPNQAEWPYEGVYRVREAGERAIPIGYRVGGTALVSTALLRAAPAEDDQERKNALARATRFLCDATTHEQMQWKDYEGGYDVRGWGYIYALSFLTELQAHHGIPLDQETSVQNAITFYASALQGIAIPEWGGWNYARRQAERPAPQAPFMTGPALQALFAASNAGIAVDAELINRALDALERSRSTTGAVEYSGGMTQADPATHVAGSAGRMLASETTLLLAGRGSVDRVRSSLDSFLAFWNELEARRSKSGTHKGPYAVAPYYFFFAHYYAAQAIEMLPEAIREEYRGQLRARLLEVRYEDGTWNDRVFPRSASYGTALTLLSLNMPDATPPAPWVPTQPNPSSD
ncbi:MAG: hypothetical protein P8L37_01475 [Phycisphaerales bacterium]|nr:hypothetical protein [Phycisphaerales bacterium]